ncbi:MAG: tetratricopeptide repeat protein, partial [Bryobacteraceae bacterium]
AKTVGKNDPAECHYAEALIDDHRKEYEAAEEHLRRAADLAPKQVGRVLAVAKYLAKRGRFKESEAMFDRAAKMAPGSPKVLFERAETYVKGQRNLNQARQMLEQYVRLPLTSNDTPRTEAEALLKKIGA